LCCEKQKLLMYMLLFRVQLTYYWFSFLSLFLYLLLPLLSSHCTIKPRRRCQPNEPIARNVVLGVRVTKAIEWRRLRLRRGSSLRIPFPIGMGLGRGPCSSQKFFCIFFFIMVHFDAFWSTFYTNCNCHYHVHDINSNILKLHMVNSATNR